MEQVEISNKDIATIADRIASGDGKPKDLDAAFARRDAALRAAERDAVIGEARERRQRAEDRAAHERDRDAALARRADVERRAAENEQEIVRTIEALARLVAAHSALWTEHAAESSAVQSACEALGQKPPRPEVPLDDFFAARRVYDAILPKLPDGVSLDDLAAMVSGGIR